MKAHVIIKVAAILLLVALGSSAASGQGLSSVLERLNGINARLTALEAQKKEGRPAGGESVAADQGRMADTALEHGMAILQLRIDALNASVARLEAGLREAPAEHQAAAAPTVASAVTEHKVAEAPAVMSAVTEHKVAEAPVVAVKADAGAPAVKRDSLPAAPQQSFLQVKYPISFYGYIKLDGSYDGSRVSTGNYMRWVDTAGPRDAQFNITARQTRLGLNFGGPKIAKSEAGGKLEIDFYGGGEENKNSLMLRQAYMKVAWSTIDFAIVAGQTNDVISPLNPSTMNYVVNWWSGNIGYRRPQFRLTKGFGLGHNVGLRFELAAARSIGGENTGLPSAQGRVALSVPLWTGKKTTLGISGHTGKEENDSHTWSAGLDLSLPILKKTTLDGEFWTGSNLDSYLGGIGQGLKGTAKDPLEIAAHGGWFALNTGPYRDWQFGAGASIDNPSDTYLVRGDRAQNMSTFGNIRYSLNEAVETGVELSYWETKYKDMDHATDVRLQWSWLYKF